MRARRVHRVAGGFGLWLLALALPASADPRADGVQRHLQAAAKLHDSLEYEKALEQLARARALAPAPDEEVQLLLYEGIIHAEMSGHRERSQAAFRAALLLRPDARLPVKVSPKVERELEQIRRQVAQELSRTRRAQGRSSAPAAPGAAGDRPVAEARATTPPLLPGETPARGGPALELFGARVPVVPAALGGAAVAAGAGGAVFGLMTRSALDQAHRATYQDEAYARWQDANRTAPLANALFIAAGVAAGSAVAAYFLLPAPGGDPGPGGG